MEIKPSGSQPSGKGPEANFTGNVRIDPLVQSPAPAVIAVDTTMPSTWLLGSEQVPLVHSPAPAVIAVDTTMPST